MRYFHPDTSDALCIPLDNFGYEPGMKQTLACTITAPLKSDDQFAINIMPKDHNGNREIYYHVNPRSKVL